MAHSTNKYADIMLDRISQCISEETKNLPALSGAKVSSVNSDGTINVYFPPDDNKIFTNISNQTPFNLQEGDSVELLLKDGSYNNCWIVAKHQDTFNGSFDLAEDMSNFATKEDLQNMQAALLTETDPIFAASAKTCFSASPKGISLHFSFDGSAAADALSATGASAAGAAAGSAAGAAPPAFPSR